MSSSFQLTRNVKSPRLVINLGLRLYFVPCDFLECMYIFVFIQLLFLLQHKYASNSKSRQMFKFPQCSWPQMCGCPHADTVVFS